MTTKHTAAVAVMALALAGCASDMTSAVNSHDARGQFVTFMVVARATGGDGACNGDGRSC